MLLDVVKKIQDGIEELRALRRKKVLTAEEQAAVLTCFFGTGPVTTQQSPKQQAAVLQYLLGGSFPE